MIEAAYNSNTTYAKNDTVTFNGTRYVSLVDANLNSQPTTSPAAWGLASTSQASTGFPAVGGAYATPAPNFNQAAQSGPGFNTVAGTSAQGTVGYGLGRTGESHTTIPMPAGVAGPAMLADGTPTAWGTLGKRVSDLEVRLRVIEVQLSSFHAAFGSATPASFESATPGAYAPVVPPAK
jgi:hypothetical protein